MADYALLATTHRHLATISPHIHAYNTPLQSQLVHNTGLLITLNRFECHDHNVQVTGHCTDVVSLPDRQLI